MSNNSSAKSVAVVTGGARGIGLAIGEGFLAHDHRVAVLDRDTDTLDRAVAEIDQPDTLLALHCDVSIEAQVADAARSEHPGPSSVHRAPRERGGPRTRVLP